MIMGRNEITSQVLKPKTPLLLSLTLPADDVPVRVHLIPQDLQFILRRRRSFNDLLSLKQRKAAILLRLVDGIPLVDGFDTHPLALFIVSHDGHIGDHFVRPSMGRESCPFPGAGPVEKSPLTPLC